MKNTFDKATELFEAFRKDAELQIEKSNKSAGTRARKSALELTKFLKDFRKLSVEVDKK